MYRKIGVFTITALALASGAYAQFCQDGYVNPSLKQVCAYTYNDLLDECNGITHPYFYDDKVSRWAGTGDQNAWEYVGKIQTQITDTPMMTLDSFRSDAHGAGFIDLNTHGDLGHVAVEYYLSYLKATQVSDDYADRYDDEGQQPWTFYVEAGEYQTGAIHHWGVGLTSNGVYNLLNRSTCRPDPDALVFANHCYSGVNVADWVQHAVYMGWNNTDVLCACRDSLYNALCCDPQYKHHPPVPELVFQYCNYYSDNFFVEEREPDKCWIMPCEASCYNIGAWYGTLNIMGSSLAVRLEDVETGGVISLYGAGTGKENDGGVLLDRRTLSNAEVASRTCEWQGIAYYEGYRLCYTGPEGGLSRCSGVMRASDNATYIKSASVEQTGEGGGVFARGMNVSDVQQGQNEIVPGNVRQHALGGGAGRTQAYLEEEPTRGAHMLVYTKSDHSSFLAPVFDYYEGRDVDGVNLHVRTVSGDGSVSDVQTKLATLVSDNHLWNDWCEEHPGWCDETYPTIPYLVLVGDCEPTKFVATYYIPGDPGICSPRQCASDALIADLNSDWIEDAIVTRVPCTTVQELSNLLASATRYDASFNRKGVLLVGAMNENGYDGRPVHIMDLYDHMLREIYHAPEWLEEKAYGVDWSHIAEKQAAFIQHVNAGVGWIIGWDFETSWATWPGRFVTYPDYDIGQLSRLQSAVAILPGCLMGSEQLSDATEHDGYPTQLHKLLLRDPASGTTLACAISHMNNSWDINQEMWAEMLAANIEDAPQGRTFAKIVRDTKVEFRTLYQDMFDRGWKKFLAGVAVQGALVGKPEAGTVAGLEGDGGTKNRATEKLVVSRVGEAAERITVELGHEVIVSLTVVDVTGRSVASIAGGQRLGKGQHTFWWFNRNGNGDRVASGVYILRLMTSSGAEDARKVLVLR